MALITAEWEIQPDPGAGVAGNYYATVGRYNTADNWAAKIAGAGTAQATAGYVSLEPYYSVADNWLRYRAIDITVNMNDYLMYNIEEAKIWAYCTSHGDIASEYALASNDTLILTRQNEDVRGLASGTVNYQEVLQGANHPAGIYSDDEIDATTDLSGSWLSWDLNAAGLAYLNGVGSKATWPGYAFFGIGYKGIFNGATPVWAAYNTSSMLFNEIWISLYYTVADQPIRIQKEFPGRTHWYVATGGKICVADTWHDIVEVQVCVDEAWRTVI